MQARELAPEGACETGRTANGSASDAVASTNWWRQLDDHLQQMWDGALRGEQAQVALHGGSIRNMVNTALRAAAPDPDPIPAPSVQVGGLPCIAEVLVLLRTAYQREPAGLTSYAIGCALQTITNLTASAKLPDLPRELSEVVQFALAAHRSGSIPVEQIFAANPDATGAAEAGFVARALAHHVGTLEQSANDSAHGPFRPRFESLPQRLAFESAPCGLRLAPPTAVSPETA